MGRRVERDVAPVDAKLPPPGPPAETPEASPEGRPPLIDGKPTVNGHPIPDHLAHAVPYGKTDQGLWDSNQGKVKPRVQVTRDAWDNMLAQRADQPWAGSDPFKAAVAEFGEPGMAYRALSPAVCEVRSLRGWEALVKPNGDQVKIGGMFLGKMPKHIARKRNEHYRAEGNAQLRNAAENFQIDQERAIKDSGSKGISPLRQGEVLTAHDAPERQATIGVESTRGIAE